MKSAVAVLLAATLALLPLAANAQAGWIKTTRQKGGVTLVGKTGAAQIVFDPGDAEVVAVAANDLAQDILRVTGKIAGVTTTDADTAQQVWAQQVWIGTRGHSALIDGLVASGKIDAAALDSCWECYLITAVSQPRPGVTAALVIIGSDRRGTAYGTYEVSKAIGVSPWYWWADVTPRHRDALYVAPLTRKFGPPSVKYRGIFINDEDWGLQPWAAKTYDPETGNFGPKTYARVFELLLRLKANTLWPAMHKVSAPFNADPQNARLADRYAIVMGSSHAEPMLRNNVGEWTDKPEAFNFAVNPQGVEAYWRERLKTNGGYENVYTLGMRGIHDSGIVGADTLDGKRDLLNRVITTQRRMLSEEVSPDVAHLPQIFVPYKEVLDIYKGGLDLPDDVTLVWPDDNFGYIRHMPNAAEQKRAGGSGIYYHLSYLGAPMAYLWLSTTPPALINEEMTRSYDHGADRIWIANVGDIKPAEVDISYFLALAWDVPGVRKQTQRQWLQDFAAETFGTGVAGDLGELWDAYYTSSFPRRPEHLQWNLPKQPPKTSPLNGADIAGRLASTSRAAALADKIRIHVAPEQREAFFQLADYPAHAVALANVRHFALECYYADAVKACTTHRAGHRPGQTYDFLAEARDADAQIKALTHRYNFDIAGGKWAGIMKVEPADDDWKSMRIASPPWPEAGLAMVTDAQSPSRSIKANLGLATGWQRLEGLGCDGAVMQSSGDASKPLSLTLDAGPPAVWSLTLSILPTYPADDTGGWDVVVQINDGPRLPVHFDRSRQDAAWAAGVLDNRLSQTVPIEGAGGRVTIRIYSAQPGVMVDGIELTPGPGS